MMEKIHGQYLEEKLRTSRFVILDLSSPGCAPCKKVPKIIEEILQDLKNPDVVAFEIDITEEPQIAQKLAVLGVPTIIVFEEGKEIARFNAIPKKKSLLKIFR